MSNGGVEILDTVGRTGEGPIGFENTRVVVLGMARSGAAAARLLARHGAVVRGSDLKTAGDLGIDPDVFDRAGVELRLGGYDPDVLTGAQVVVVSPGIPKDAPAYVDARKLGVPVLSELETASRFAAAPMAAVTGTNGKSTTVTVLGALIEALGRPVTVAGNVGTALSEVVEAVPADGFLVVEVSSFQLEDVETFHPRTATILNITPDHLDRYPDLDAYVNAKLRIFDRMGTGDTAVLPTEDPRLVSISTGGSGRVLRFGTEPVSAGVVVTEESLVHRREGEDRVLCRLTELGLPGPHNHRNIAAALCLLDGLGLPVADPRGIGALSSLKGLPHRLERVGEIDGVAYFNDSKATNPDSLAVALQSFSRPVVLIAGGLSKDGDYGPLAEFIRKHAARVILLGKAARTLEAAWAPAGVPLVHAGADLDRAVAEARRAARECGADTVLFSPGCASFDMFRDYEDRGDRFRQLVVSGGRSS